MNRSSTRLDMLFMIAVEDQTGERIRKLSAKAQTTEPEGAKGIAATAALGARRRRRGDGRDAASLRTAHLIGFPIDPSGRHRPLRREREAPLRRRRFSGRQASARRSAPRRWAATATRQKGRTSEQLGKNTHGTLQGSRRGAGVAQEAVDA